MLRGIFLAFVIFAIGTTPVAAQKNSAEATVIKKEVSLVRVTVVVANPDGGHITNLEKDNFRVFENGVEQEIRFLAHEIHPITMVLIADQSGSMTYDKIELLKKGLLSLVLKAHPDDEFSLITFYHDKEKKKDVVKILTGPTFVNSDDLQNAIGFVSGSKSKTPLLDAIDLGLDMIESRYKQERKKINDIGKLHLPPEEEKEAAEKEKRQYAMLIISDGGDNASRVNESQVKRKLKESQAQVYAIGTFEKDIELRLDRPDEEKRGPQLLSDLTELTGGRVLRTELMQYVPELVAAVMEELANEDDLYYTPGSDKSSSENGKKKSKKEGAKKASGNCKDWVKIEVKIRQPKGMPQLLTPFVRRGYCRDPQPEP